MRIDIPAGVTRGGPGVAAAGLSLAGLRRLGARRRGRPRSRWVWWTAAVLGAAALLAVTVLAPSGALGSVIRYARAQAGRT